MQDDLENDWLDLATQWLKDYGIESAEIAWPTLFGFATLAITDEFRRLFFSGLWSMIAAILILAFYAGIQGWLVWRGLKKRARITELRAKLARQQAEQRLEVSRLEDSVKAMQSMREIRALEVAPLIYSYLEHLALRELEFGSMRCLADFGQSKCLIDHGEKIFESGW